MTATECLLEEELDEVKVLVSGGQPGRDGWCITEEGVPCCRTTTSKGRGRGIKDFWFVISPREHQQGSHNATPEPESQLDLYRHAQPVLKAVGRVAPFQEFSISPSIAKK